MTRSPRSTRPERKTSNPVAPLASQPIGAPMSDADTTEPAVNFEVDTEPAAPEEDSVVGEKPITDAEDVNEWRRRRRRDIPAVLRREAARRERPLPRACEERRRLRQAVAHRAGSAPRDVWLIRPTSSSPTTTWTIPTLWPPPSTTCWHASHTWHRAGRPTRSGRALHPRPPRLTWPPFCGDEPNEKRPMVAMSHIVAVRN